MPSERKHLSQAISTQIWPLEAFLGAPYGQADKKYVVQLCEATVTVSTGYKISQSCSMRLASAAESHGTHLQVRSRYFSGGHGGRLVQLQGSTAAVRAALVPCVQALLEDSSIDAFHTDTSWGYEAPNGEVRVCCSCVWVTRVQSLSHLPCTQAKLHCFPLHHLLMWRSKGHFAGSAQSMQLRLPDAGCWAPFQAVLQAFEHPPLTQGAPAASSADVLQLSPYVPTAACLADARPELHRSDLAEAADRVMLEPGKAETPPAVEPSAASTYSWDEDEEMEDLTGQVSLSAHILRWRCCLC